MADVAWSEIHSAKDGTPVVVQVGDDVDAGTLGLDDNQYQELKDAGSVREHDYPEDIGSDQSPLEYYKQELMKISETGELPSAELMADFQAAQVEPGPNDPNPVPADSGNGGNGGT